MTQTPPKAKAEIDLTDLLGRYDDKFDGFTEWRGSVNKAIEVLKQDYDKTHKIARDAHTTMHALLEGQASWEKRFDKMEQSQQKLQEGQDDTKNYARLIMGGLAVIVFLLTAGPNILRLLNGN